MQAKGDILLCEKHAPQKAGLILKHRLSPIAYSKQELVFFESDPVTLCRRLLMQWTAVEGEGDSILSKDRVTGLLRWTSRSPDQTQVLMNEPKMSCSTNWAVDMVTTDSLII